MPATATATATTDASWTGDPLIRWTRWMPHSPHPPQHAFLRLSHLGVEEALYGGAARGGKSDALLLAALQYVDVPGYSAIIFRRISPDLHGADGLVPRAKEWLMPRLGEKAWNGERLSWTFPSGATLRFGHMQYEDDKFKFQGHRYQFAGFDELTHFTETQYRYLFSRLDRPAEGPLSEVPLRMRASSNPGGPGHVWVKRRFIDKQTDPNDLLDTEEKAQARIFIPARVADNPSIDREAYVRSLGYLEPEVRAQLLDGDWDARQPGNWYFDDRWLAAAAQAGRILEQRLQARREDDDERFDPTGGVVHLGIDWGESSHCLLGWPLDSGGWFIAREFVDQAGEPSEKTHHMLALNTFGLPFGRAFFDAAGVQSQKTFNVTADRALGSRRPRAKAVPFGAQAPRTAGSARKSLKGLGCTYLRRLARRAHGVAVLDGRVVLEGADGATWIPGPVPGHLAISPRCPVLLDQLKRLERNHEDPTGSWIKDDDQHGPDAAVALVAHSAARMRAAPNVKAAA